MSSWQEYKKENGYSQTTNKSNSYQTSGKASSSWQKYKEDEEERLRKLREEREAQQREEQKKQQEEAQRQQEEQKREEEQNKQEVLPKANEENSNKYTIEANNKKIEDLQKQLQSAGNNVNKVRELGTQIKNLKDENDKLQNPEKYQTDVSRTFENLGLGLKKGLMDFSDNANRIMENRWDNQILEEQTGKTQKEMYKDILGEASDKDLFGRNKVEQEEKWINEKNRIKNKMASNIEHSDTVIGKKLTELAPSLGQQIPGIVLPGPVGLTYFIGSATEAYRDEAKERGITGTKADVYSGLMGAFEGLTDAIGGSLTKSVYKNFVKGTTKEALKSFGLDVLENFAEEAIMEPINETTATLTGGKDKANWDNMVQRMLSSGFDGALSGIIMAGTSAGIGKAVNVTTKLNNNQQVSSQEIVDAVNETIKSDKVNQEELKTIIKENTSEIINRELQNNEVNIEDIDWIDGSEGQYSKQIENNIETKVELDKILNNKDLPMQGYKYETSDNVKINQLRQQANQYFNNSQEAHKFVEMLEKIITDKDIEIRLDANLKTADGRMVNGSYSNGVITINPNSTRTGEFIAIHELTHAIGTDSMKNIVETYRKSNKDFDTAVEKLLQNYKSTEITEEALSDVSAQLFGNQEFINNIANTNPGFFKKIYNEIKYLWHQFRGYKNQNQFIEDLYYKWTQAYNSNNKLNGENNFSIQIDNNGNKYVKVDTDQDIFEGIDKKDYNKIAKMYIQDYLMGKTQLSDNDITIIDRKSANKYTNPGKKQQNFDKKMQLTPELKNVLEIAQKDNTSLPTKDTSKYQNWEYYKFIFELSGKNFEGTVNIGIDSNGNKHFYEINKIKEVDDISGTSLNRSTTSSINNSITSQNNDVNTTTKYSMQESENNSGSFSMDNKGRTLTKEQQEYFKDSKVRDENGNLLVMYHGTDNGGFNTFDINQFGKNDNGWLGKGFYLTNDFDYAESYAKELYSDEYTQNGEVKETYINLKNPYILTDEKYSRNPTLLQEELGAKNSTEVTEILKTKGYDGVLLEYEDYNGNNFKEVMVFNSNQIKNVDNTNPTSNPDIRYSQNTPTWQKYLDKNFNSTGTRTNLKDIGVNVAPTAKNNVAPSMENNTFSVGEYTRKQTMNPVEISNLKPEDASTTPKLEQKNYKKGNKQSSFLSNIITDSKFLNEDLRQEMSKEENIRYYEGITNEKTLEKAYNKLQEDGQDEVIKWHSKDSKNATAEDVAEGWILLKQYQDNGDYQSAVEVAKKMRDIGTTAGQTVQAYNILSRLTPEGMFYYAQSELNEAYNRMVEGKSKKWIENNKSKFDLTPEETQKILDIMQDVSTLEDGYDKKVRLAEVQKIITDKIPPTAGQSIKAWMRISMLFNPKTQVRNIMGNAVILPVNMFSDSVSAGIDRLIAKKTGVRTTGNTNVINYGKGFGKGLYQSYNDFKKGINTRNIEGNRFEVSEGKSFKDKGIRKGLNRVDNLLSFMLDAGDRGFYEATFTNSINNQMILNKVNTPTQEMIDIATNEALQRTWQDNNKYTQSVLKIRNILNNANVKGYGLGDVLIPFAKTPANLTKAIVDYSPAGLIKALTVDARKFKNSLYNGQYTSQMQHQFVQNLGKATAGSFLYVLGYALAKAGIATGEADEDKDVKNFMKNSLGISSYSIKIGNKSFSYDWAQPVATPLAIMTNYVKYSEENPDANALEKGINAMNIGTEQLLQQSFMESLNTVLNGNGTTLENLSQAVLDLPARAVPTFSKQIADMVDGTQRTTFEYDRPIKSATNSVIAKIPFASKTLPASVDTLGNEIQKYGGNNNIWNVMFNPANTNKGQLSKAGKEIYNVYKQTGDKTIFPRTAPYYINNKNEKVTMNAEQRSEFQTISGKYVENSLSKLLNDSDYKKLSNEEKAKVINEIVSDSYSKAKYDILKIDSKEYEKLRTILKDVKPVSYYNYKFKTKDMKKDSDKINVLVEANYTNKEKTTLYEQYMLSSKDKQYPIIKETFTENGLNITKYLKYKNQEFSSDKKDDGTINGKSISGSRKKKVWNYIENMDITYTQKLILYGLEYTPSDNEQRQIVNYIDSLPKTYQEKLEILDQFQGFTIYKNGTFKY